MKLTGGDVIEKPGTAQGGMIVTQDGVVTKQCDSTKYGSDGESCSTEDGDQRFGVRSYLHHFYEDCAGVALCRSDIVAPDEIEKRQKRKRLVLCVTCVAGLLLAVTGMIILLYSFGEPARTSDGSGEAPSWDNYVIMICGASVFCVGGTIVSMCVVMIGLGILEIKQELLERNQFQERLWRGLSIKQPQQPGSTRNYDVTAVQPLFTSPASHDVTQQPLQVDHSTTVSSQ